MKYEHILTTITVIIGVCVAVLAYQQYRLGKDRFRLDLFEKRFAVYKGVQILLTHVLGKAKVDIQNIYDFRAATQDATFLFEADILELIKQIDGKALDLNTIGEQLTDLYLDKGKRTLLVEQRKYLIEWLTNQLSRLQEVFSPYLKFGAWK